MTARRSGDDKRQPYLERFIHGAIFEARPDVNAVVHAHAEDTLPFGIAGAQKLVPVIHSGAFIGGAVPVWDIADVFGDATNLLVTNVAQGRGPGEDAGRRPPGADAGPRLRSGRTVVDRRRAVERVPAAQRPRANERHAHGRFKPLSEGEIGERASGGETYGANTQTTWRAWEYWAYRAKCEGLLGPRPQ